MSEKVRGAADRQTQADRQRERKIDLAESDILSWVKKSEVQQERKKEVERLGDLAESDI